MNLFEFYRPAIHYALYSGLFILMAVPDSVALGRTIAAVLLVYIVSLPYAVITQAREGKKLSLTLLASIIVLAAASVYLNNLGALQNASFVDITLNALITFFGAFYYIHAANILSQELIRSRKIRPEDKSGQTLLLALAMFFSLLGIFYVSSKVTQVRAG
ncbi:hypothetical protein [Glycocaulis sp.]|uniref:hypothetical protein n=1 Tax=Glycocaulis sp. TaxID=1969725 RepID=UPI003F6E994E